ncbi:MotA/TolQ/ExbB proton channel family protein [Verrucomicrobiota bacterium]
MFTLMQQGGGMLWLILASGIVVVVVFVERAFHVHRAKIKTDDFLKGVCNILRRNNIDEAMSICEETPGPVAFMVRAAILHRDQNRDMIERAMNDAALTEIARMERRFAVIATVAQVAPLLGLLGTILGMIQTYLVIQQKAPLVHAGDLAGGIWVALITTAAGLGVAILSYIGYNMLVSKVNAIEIDMERSVGEMVGFLTGSGTLIAEESEEK